MTIPFSRCFAMPSAETFSVKPIGEFVQRYLAVAEKVREMIRTINLKSFQLRFDWTGFALFFGKYRSRAVKMYWWRYPRIVLDLTDHNPVIIGRRFAPRPSKRGK